MSSYNALYPPNVGAQSAVHIHVHITDREYNIVYYTIYVNSRYIYSTQRNRETELQACTRTAVQGYAIPVNVGFTPHINIGDVSTFPGVRRF